MSFIYGSLDRRMALAALIDGLNANPPLVRRFDVTQPAYGARGDGVTNDTAAWNAAIAACSAAGGGVVWVPKGTYLVGDLVLQSHVTLLGEGRDISRCVFHAGASFLAAANAGTGGTSDPTTNLTGIRIYGLGFDGLTETLGFSEGVHLISLSAVTDVEVRWCDFRAWQGDAIYVGSSNVAGVERHNRRVMICDNTFDGVTTGQRHAITVIDCEGFTARDNYGTRIGAAGMVACIDVEPDANAFHRVRDILIEDNTFDACPHITGISCLLQPQSAMTLSQQGLTVRRNTLDGCLAGLGFVGAPTNTDATEPYVLAWADNIVRNCTTPFIIDGGVGVEIARNWFIDCDGFGSIGYTLGAAVRRALIEDNWFVRCGHATTDAVRMQTVAHVQVRHNHFIDCGVPASGGRGIHLLDNGAGGNSATYLEMTDNEFLSPAGTTSIGVSKDATYVVTNSTCREERNISTLPSPSQFVAVGSTVSAAPTSGTWAVGNIVLHDTPVSGGHLGWICTTAGSPGTWKTYGAIA